MKRNPVRRYAQRGENTLGAWVVWQLANDRSTYGKDAGGFILVRGPFAEEEHPDGKVFRSEQAARRAAAEANAAVRRNPRVKPERVHVWEERDRLHIDLQDENDNTILEWWDDDARQAFDDGFLDRRNLFRSAVEYAKHLGVL